MLLQIDTIALAEEAIIEAAEPAQESINLFEMAQYGGWIMVILAILLAVACYIFIARLVVIKQATREDKSFMDRIRDYIHEGKIDSAINLCKQTDTPSAHMIEKGISRIGRPMQDVQVAVENVGNLEVGKLEKGLVIMATIAAGAPMLGFLGTVLGMVQTFYNMAQTSGGIIEMSALSTGMYQAMVTTIGGLIIGVTSNGMDILGVNSYFQKVLQAIIIFAAVYVDGRLNAKKK